MDSFHSTEAVAIVGMSCRWPGNVFSPSELWELLYHGKTGYTNFESNILNWKGFYHPKQQRPGSIYTRGGYFLQHDPRSFDHGFFGIAPLEAVSMDPAQRQLLEVTFEAFENAGEIWSQFAGSKTGVFVGNFNFDHHIMQLRDPDNILPYSATGGGPTILSNRINHVFNLQGPSVTIDTACSSSMYALHLAVQAIRNGDCDAAIVAGSNLTLGPDVQLFTTKLGAISPTSTCHTFDIAADGYARADGFGALYLKTVRHALDDHNPIRAIVRGTAINSNGHTAGITYPSQRGQEDVIRSAYRNAGNLDFQSTGYFECHGTGTAVGDVVEVAAIGRLFAEGRKVDPLLIGSIKTNLGHSESASGIAGIMKAVLAMEHGIIPPTIGIKELNPDIDFEGNRVKVVVKATPWPNKPVRRASINSFGYGGANAHCILDYPDATLLRYAASDQDAVKSLIPSSNGFHPQQNGRRDAYARFDRSSKPSRKYGPNITLRQEWKSVDAIASQRNNTSVSSVRSAVRNTSRENLTLPDLTASRNAQVRRLVLLTFSAYDNHSLLANISNVANVAQNYRLGDLAYTLSARRSRFAERAFAIESSTGTQSIKDPEILSFDRCNTGTRRIAYVFTGQGAQWSGMGAALYQEFEAFRNSITYQDQILHALDPGLTGYIKDLLLDDAVTANIHKPQHSQTLCTAVQVAIVNLLRSWKVSPTICIGHSSGEIAASYAAGHYTAAEAVIVAYLRGKIAASNQQDGLMLAVGLGRDEVECYLSKETEVKIAAVNSHASVTLSGLATAVSRVQTQLESHGVFVRRLKTGGNAYHSHHMALLGEEYETSIVEAFSRLSSIIALELLPTEHARLISSVTPAKEVGRTTLSPSYWRQNLERPVLFEQAVQNLAVISSEDPPLLIEIGPHPALRASLREISTQFESGTIEECMATLTRAKDCLRSMLELCGKLFLKNAEIDLAAVNAVDRLDGGSWRREHGSVCLDMPCYQYHYGPILYHENRHNREYRLRKHPHHEILGVEQPGSSKFRPSWRNVLKIKDVPWLADHRLSPHPVFPASGYIAMAIEALSQVCEKDEIKCVRGFTLRDLSIKSAMRISEIEYGTETILNLQPVYMNYPRDSCKWFKFDVSSVPADSDEWTEHCSGLIKAETDDDDRARSGTPEPVSTSTDSDQWYRRFEEIGLAYGPSFQGLSDIRLLPDINTTLATIDLQPLKDPALQFGCEYVVHPATLDSLLQLTLISFYQGQVERTHHAFVPIGIDNLTVWKPDTELVNSYPGQGRASGALRGLRGGYADAQLYESSGGLLCNLEGLRCTLYGGSDVPLDETQTSRDVYMRLAWRPMVSTLPNPKAQSLFPPMTDISAVSRTFHLLDQLSTTILVDISIQHPDLISREYCNHLGKFSAWVRRSVKAIGARPVIGNAGNIFEKSRSERSSDIQHLSDLLQDVAEAKLIKRIYDRLPEIMSGETAGLHVALEDGLLQEMYTSGIGISAGYEQLLCLVDLLAHENQQMSILEIGAGTGGATRRVLHKLSGNKGFRRYTSYTFTDVTSSFLAAAQQEFADYNGMEYGTLDIEKDPLQQGYSPSYDLIIASQVLHATANLAETVLNARRLLRPRGKMLLLELTRTHVGAGLALGTFPDYWKGDQDGRIDSPFASRDLWHRVLLNNGFSGVDIALDDHEGELAMASTLLTSKVSGLHSPFSSSTLGNSDVYLVYHRFTHPLSRALEKRLRSDDQNSIFVSLANASKIPENSRIISLLDIEGSLLLAPNCADFEALKKLVSSSCWVIWLAQGDAISASHPESALFAGAMRAISLENPQTRFVHLGLEDGFLHRLCNTANLIIKNVPLFLAQDDRASKDSEYTLYDGLLHLSRLYPDTRLNDEHALRLGKVKNRVMLPMNSQGPLTICFDQIGILSSLYFKSDVQMLGPLPANWVEIETRAIGFNMKDLAVASARFDWDHFSTECAGIVSKVGSGSSRLRIGDRVFGAVPGNMGNYVRGPEACIQIIPKQYSFEEAATIPVVYMTAVYSFLHLARPVAGESVLIQSAAGGLGLAAIRIAQHCGAEVYATVGNDHKADVLYKQFGINPDRIFSSRDTSITKKIMLATNNKGVDVVLSSAAGAQMLELLRCLAPAGRFIEVGRTDVMERSTLGLGVFERNASFSSFDLGILNKQRPELVAGLMREVLELCHAEIVKPITYLKTFDVEELEQAMLHFSKGTHIGKVVITYAKPDSLLKMEPTIRRASFDGSANYLLVGCLGGVGQRLSRWMVDRGARILTFLSKKSSRRPTTIEFESELRSFGATVNILEGVDVTDMQLLKTAISKAEKFGTIKGIVNAAMIEGDSPFEATSASQLHSVLAPKVQGTLNLHEATLHLPLSFFLMTGSVVTLTSMATQSSYAAANAFLDAFARFRRSRNLPSQTISLGVITDVGFLQNKPEVQRAFERNGLYGTSSTELVQLLEAAFLPQSLNSESADAGGESRVGDKFSDAHLITGLEPQRLAHIQGSSGSSYAWHSDARLSGLLLAISDQINGSGKGKIQKGSTSALPVLDEMKAAQSREAMSQIVEESLRERLAKLLFVPTPTDISCVRSLASYGVDSMIAAELRNWCVKVFDTDFSFQEIVGKELRVSDMVEKITSKWWIDIKEEGN